MPSTSTVASVAAIPPTSDALPPVTVECGTDPQPAALPAEFDIELPALPTGSNDQSVLEYIISLPDDVTASPVAECVVGLDGVVLSDTPQQSPAVLLTA